MMIREATILTPFGPKADPLIPKRLTKQLQSKDPRKQERARKEVRKLIETRKYDRGGTTLNDMIMERNRLQRNVGRLSGDIGATAYSAHTAQLLLDIRKTRASFFEDLSGRDLQKEMIILGKSMQELVNKKKVRELTREYNVVRTALRWMSVEQEKAADDKEREEILYEAFKIVRNGVDDAVTNVVDPWLKAYKDELEKKKQLQQRIADLDTKIRSEVSKQDAKIQAWTREQAITGDFYTKSAWPRDALSVRMDKKNLFVRFFFKKAEFYEESEEPGFVDPRTGQPKSIQGYRRVHSWKFKDFRHVRVEKNVLIFVAEDNSNKGKDKKYFVRLESEDAKQFAAKVQEWHRTFHEREKGPPVALKETYVSKFFNQIIDKTREYYDKSSILSPTVLELHSVQGAKTFITITSYAAEMGSGKTTEEELGRAMIPTRKKYEIRVSVNSKTILRVVPENPLIEVDSIVAALKKDVEKRRTLATKKGVANEAKVLKRKFPWIDKRVAIIGAILIAVIGSATAVAGLSAIIFRKTIARFFRRSYAIFKLALNKLREKGWAPGRHLTASQKFYLIKLVEGIDASDAQTLALEYRRMIPRSSGLI